MNKMMKSKSGVKRTNEMNWIEMTELTEINEWSMCVNEEMNELNEIKATE